MRKISDSTIVISIVLSIAFSALLISTSSSAMSQVFFTYCPTEPIEDFEETVKFEMVIGNADIINFFVSVTQNGEFYSRFYIDTDFNPAPNIFELPKAREVSSLGYGVERGDYGDEFIINVEIIDENYNSADATCKVMFSEI